MTWCSYNPREPQAYFFFFLVVLTPLRGATNRGDDQNKKDPHSGSLVGECEKRVTVGSDTQEITWNAVQDKPIPDGQSDPSKEVKIWARKR